MSLSRSRFIDIEVTNCCSCPFHFSQPDDFSVGDGDGRSQMIPAGSSCLHPSNRDGNRIATLKEMEEVGITAINQFLRHVYGEPFPPICPLKQKEIGAKMSGQRNIDLT